MSTCGCIPYARELAPTVESLTTKVSLQYNQSMETRGIEQNLKRHPNQPDNLEPIAFPAGRALIGTDDPVIPGDGEGPSRSIELAAYALASTTVTNAQFSAFVSNSGYITDAERAGQSMIFQSQTSNDAKVVGYLLGTPWWQVVKKASWHNPTGSVTATPAPSDFPVVHVSWNDAQAYCQWAQGRLPSEAEWEQAARAGQGDVRYPWSNELDLNSADHYCNIWQGKFPDRPDLLPQPVPVTHNSPNRFGFYNMCGNVWEWTADYFDNGIGKSNTRRIMKGGSYLCHKSYCYRYRIAARIGVPTNSSTSHQGFRIAFDKK